MKARPVQVLLMMIVSMLAGTLLARNAGAQAASGGLRGQVTDPSGATVGGATVLLSTDAGATDTTTNKDGFYEFKNVAPGKYSVKVVANGFAQFSQDGVTISAGQAQKLNIALTIEAQEQKVTVNDSTTTVDVNPANNASTIVLKDKDLEALSDDPDEFQSELQALAGPSAGPNGGQIYIDGFTAGQLPPKSSIREIRINQNPFSAEYDKLGYGRIEIFTKPGTDQFHGQFMGDGNSSAFDALSPFPPDQPPFHSELFNGSISGPISKKASFFFTAQFRDINDSNIVNAVVPNPSDPNPISANFTQAVPN